MLGKILIFALIAAVIYFMLKSKLSGKKSKENDEIEVIGNIYEDDDLLEWLFSI